MLAMMVDLEDDDEWAMADELEDDDFDRLGSALLVFFCCCRPAEGGGLLVPLQ